MATTPFVAYGGFVDSVHTDKVQSEIPDGVTLQQNPIQLLPSYLGFTVGGGGGGGGDQYLHKQVATLAERRRLHRRSSLCLVSSRR